MSTAHFKNQNPARVFLYPCISEQSVVLCTAVTGETSISPTLNAAPGGREWICIYIPLQYIVEVEYKCSFFQKKLDKHMSVYQSFFTVLYVYTFGRKSPNGAVLYIPVITNKQDSCD